VSIPSADTASRWLVATSDPLKEPTGKIIETIQPSTKFATWKACRNRQIQPDTFAVD